MKKVFKNFSMQDVPGLCFTIITLILLLTVAIKFWEYTLTLLVGTVFGIVIAGIISDAKGE